MMPTLIAGAGRRALDRRLNIWLAFALVAVLVGGPMIWLRHVHASRMRAWQVVVDRQRHRLDEIQEVVWNLEDCSRADVEEALHVKLEPMPPYWSPEREPDITCLGYAEPDGSVVQLAFRKDGEFGRGWGIKTAIIPLPENPIPDTIDDGVDLVWQHPVVFWAMAWSLLLLRWPRRRGLDLLLMAALVPTVACAMSSRAGTALWKASLWSVGLGIASVGILRLWQWWHRPINPYACPSCQYDLRGNVSGRCPECGWLIRGRVAERIGPPPVHSGGL